MYRKAKVLMAIMLFFPAVMGFAELKVASIFTDGLILQRKIENPVWGTAKPKEKITVSFGDQKLVTQADSGGNWMTCLEPLDASKTGRTLTVIGSSSKIAIKDVLVGEVWLCSGQSNMASRFTQSKNRYIDPEFFKNDLSGLRANSGNRGGWAALDKNTQNRFCCVAFYFGYELYKKLDIPVGLIQRKRSGTPIQAWMPKEAAEEIRKELDIPPKWNDWNNEHHHPGAEFSDQIQPIIPVAIRGAIWYQGERNAKTYTGWEYRHLLPFMIKTWRRLWAEKSGRKLRKFPFYYIQVPTQEHPTDAEWPWLRDGMRRVLDTTENTGMAVFYDYGPSLHPYYKDKKHAGHRLALWALSKDYDQDVPAVCGPLLDKVEIAGSRMVLSFRHTGSGLENRSGEKYLEFFEIAAEDGKYAPAKAWIKDNKVIVQSDRISNPAYVRYLFRKPEPDPEVSLINAEGIPASSFMTDDFKPERPGN